MVNMTMYRVLNFIDHIKGHGLVESKIAILSYIGALEDFKIIKKKIARELSDNIGEAKEISRSDIMLIFLRAEQE